MGLLFGRQPKWLYDLKPVLLFLLGVVTGVLLETGWATLSSLCLILAGVLIVAMRCGWVVAGNS